MLLMLIMVKLVPSQRANSKRVLDLQSARGRRRGEAARATEFDFDRATVALELKKLQRMIEEGARQTEMVAAERVFAKPLSRALIRRARKLHLVARDLERLLRLVARAHLPKEAERPKPESLLPLRLQSRDH